MTELQERVQGLIEILEHMRKRPGMYFRLDRIGLQNFLHGLALGCHISGIQLGRTDQDKIDLDVLHEHGLRFSAADITTQLDQCGYPIEKIIDEALIIHIETLKRRYNIEGGSA